MSDSDSDHLLVQVQRIARMSEKDFFRPFDPSLAELLHVDGADTARTGVHLDRLLVAVDLSDCSRAALDYATALRERAGVSEFIVLHVLSLESMRASIRKRYPFTPRTTTGPVVFDDSELVDLVAEEREKSYATLQCFVHAASTPSGIELQVLIGDPVECIVAAAEQARADILVMGTHGRTGLQRVVMGSVAERVVRVAPCAVLTVKES